MRLSLMDFFDGVGMRFDEQNECGCYVFTHSHFLFLNLSYSRYTLVTIFLPSCHCPLATCERGEHSERVRCLPDFKRFVFCFSSARAAVK
jgi:hypothetical protein